jgi:hypothetical protein
MLTRKKHTPRLWRFGSGWAATQALNPERALDFAVSRKRFLRSSIGKVCILVGVNKGFDVVIGCR